MYFFGVSKAKQRAVDSEIWALSRLAEEANKLRRGDVSPEEKELIRKRIRACGVIIQNGHKK